MTHSEKLEEAPRRTERDKSHAIRNRGYPPRYDGDDGRLPQVRSINGLYRDGPRDSKDSTRMKNTKLQDVSSLRSQVKLGLSTNTAKKIKRSLEITQVTPTISELELCPNHHEHVCTEEQSLRVSSRMR